MQKDGFIPDKREFLKAVTQIEKNVHIDRSHTIPYTAGYSTDGKTIYIDRRLPKGFTHANKFYDVTKLIVLHEIIEKLLLETYKLNYQEGHNIALRIEMAACDSMNLNWTIYNKWVFTWAQYIEHSSMSNPPKDLDLQPYKDSHDTKELQKIKQNQ